VGSSSPEFAFFTHVHRRGVSTDAGSRGDAGHPRAQGAYPYAAVSSHCCDSLLLALLVSLAVNGPVNVEQ
jgi:hypothetical protein